MIAAYTEDGLDDRDGEGLAAIAEIGHVARLCLEEFLGRGFAVRSDEAVEMVLYGFKVRLAVPERIVCIEGDDAYIVQIYHFLQCGQMPLIMRFDEVASNPSGKLTSGTSA